MTDEFTDFVKDITLTEREILEQLERPKNPLAQPPGPNSWDSVKDDPNMFATEHDFELYDQGDVVVFYPISEAALQYGYRFLPEDCPRWGAKGFVVDAKEIDLFCRQARDTKPYGLISEEDFDNAMHEMDQLLRGMS